jgi:sugar/nucleoside kinase (ribokinase family)
MEKLTNFLKKARWEISVIVMPDFFLDRLLTVEQTPSEFVKTVEEVVSRKGGSVDGIRQTDIRGGNAVNVGSALAALGAKVIPIVCTSQLGRQFLEYHLKPLGVDLSHVKVAGSASLTTALELLDLDGKVNVMFRDLGALAGFGPTDLSDEDFKEIGRADYVCVFNWAGTRSHGTQLAQKVFDAVKKGGTGKTYFDTADPTPNQQCIPELMEKVLKTRQVDVLSLNENEATTYSEYLGGPQPKKVNQRLDEVALDSARFLAKHVSARIDLHTTTFSATFTKHGETMVPAFKVNALRATGAGDAWDAGNIFADGNGLSDECRLTLANAVSACYLTDPNGTHPTRERLLRFLREFEFSRFAVENLEKA